MDLTEAFASHDDEFLKFGDIEQPRHSRPDLCAFLMLADVVPQAGDMVVGAAHDQIWLGVDCEKLAAVATDDLIRDLARCGVFYDDDVESLSMFP